MERKIEKRKRGCWNVTVGISTTASEKYDFGIEIYTICDNLHRSLSDVSSDKDIFE